MNSLDDTGWMVGVKRCDSPNFNDRPPQSSVDLLVVHNISLPPGEFGSGCVHKFFCNELDFDMHSYFDQIRDLQVSPHFLIERTGELTQFVSTKKRAWHAGRSSFEGRTECNDYSIGIELEGTDDQAFSSQQYLALVDLAASLMQVYPAITSKRIVGHSDIAPGRKTDPGPFFDWSEFKSQLQIQREGK